MMSPIALRSMQPYFWCMTEHDTMSRHTRMWLFTPVVVPDGFETGYARSAKGVAQLQNSDALRDLEASTALRTPTQA